MRFLSRAISSAYLLYSMFSLPCCSEWLWWFEWRVARGAGRGARGGTLDAVGRVILSEAPIRLFGVVRAARAHSCSSRRSKRQILRFAQDDSWPLAPSTARLTPSKSPRRRDRD